MQNVRSRIRAAELRGLFDYWDEKRGERAYILRSQLEPSDIVSLLPNIFILEVEKATRRFRVRLVGTGIVAQFGEDHTGRYVDEIDLGDIAERELAGYRHVVDAVEPHLELTEFRRRKQGRVRMERLALPMSRNGRTVDYILGAAILHYDGSRGASRNSEEAICRA